MSEQKNGAKVLPLIILHSRKVETEEKKNFYKFFNNVIEINKYNEEKTLLDLSNPDTCIFVSLTTTIGRDWWSSNCKYANEKTDPIVWLKNSGDEDTAESLKYKYETKRIHTHDYKDKASFLHNLYQEAISPILSKKKKVFF